MEDFLIQNNIHNHLVQACQLLNFTEPTPIQREVIPQIIKRKSVRARAPTGTGKTAAYVIPLIHLLSNDPFSVFALVLAPTRELGMQIEQQFQAFGKNIRIKTATVLGGVNQMRQCNNLIYHRPHIIIATPGRLSEIANQTDIIALFKNLQFLVLDEADFLHNELQNELNQVRSFLPKCPCLEFSATLADMEDIGERASLDEKFILVPDALKDVYLYVLLQQFLDIQVIVFTDSCANAQLLSMVFEHLGTQIIALHSLLPQDIRLTNLQRFRSCKAGILLATDVASRGLDMPQVKLVINHNVPRNSKLYVHRIGRTGRAGKEGTALTMVSQYEVDLVLHIEQKTGRKLAEMFSEDDFKRIENQVVDTSNKMINAKALVMHVNFTQKLQRPSLDNHRRRNLLNKGLKRLRRVQISKKMNKYHDLKRQKHLEQAIKRTISLPQLQGINRPLRQSIQDNSPLYRKIQPWSSRASLDQGQKNKPTLPKIQTLDSVYLPESYQKYPLTAKTRNDDLNTSENISFLSLLENQRSLERVKILQRQELLGDLQLSQMNSPTSLSCAPSKDQFLSVIERLKKIGQNKSYGNKQVELTDERPFNTYLSSSEIQYFKINLKGEMIPLRIIIKRQWGKLKIYTSKTVQYPSDEQHDDLYMRDLIVIKETGYIFKIEQICLACVALNDTAFEIVIQYGQGRQGMKQPQIHLDGEDQKDNAALRDQVDQRIRKVIEKKTKFAQDVRNKNNYIQINKVIITPSSPERRQRIEQIQELKEKRRINALIKRSKLIQEKKVRTINTLNKRAIKQQEQRLERIRYENERQLKELQRGWMGMVGMAYIARKIEKQRIRLKTIKLLDSLRTCQARRIQYSFFRLNNGMRGDDLALLRANHHLHLFFFHTLQTVVKPVKIQLIQAFRETAKNHSVAHKFEDYYAKIVKMQRLWRSYGDVRKERFNNILTIWNNIINNLTVDSRGRLKKGSDKYFKITTHARNQVIHDYLLQCRKRYRILFRNYYKNTSDLLKMGVKAFIQNFLNSDNEYVTAAPNFEYYPTEDQVLGLVERALTMV